MSANTLILPDLGEVTEIEVTEILVTKGQHIKVGDPTMIIESDKATIEVPADQAGVVSDILVSVGDQLQESAKLLILDVAQATEDTAGQSDVTPAADSNNILTESDAPTNQPTPPVVEQNTDIEPATYKTAKLQAKSDDQSVSQQSVSKWKTSIKSSPSARDLADTLGVDISKVKGTGKRTTVIPADVQAFHDTLSQPLSTASSTDSDVASVTDLEAQLTAVSEKIVKSTNRAPQQEEPQQEISQQEEPQIATDNNQPEPATNPLNQTQEISAAATKTVVEPTVNRSEPEVTTAFIPTAVKPASLPDLPSAMQPPPKDDSAVSNYSGGAQMGQQAASQPSKVSGYKGQAVPLTKLQKIVAGRMSASWQHIPHVTQNHTVDMTDLNQTIQNYKSQWHDSGIKITVLAFIVKAIALTLEQEKLFRSMYDDADNQLVLTDTYDIGFAVDTNPGLVVPVVRDCLHKDIVSIAKEITELSNKARNRKLLPAQMQGGVFTISSLGPAITGHFSPIIFPPQVAIMGVSGIFEKFDPSSQRRGAITPHLPLSFSYDHRVVNGADAVRFLVAFEQFLTAL